jgi:cysteinyl-tRNA synthetase
VLGGTGEVTGVICAEFAAAMDDDLSVPAALAALQGVVREGNKLLADGVGDLRGALLSVRAMLDVLGLDPLSPQWAEGEATSDLHAVVERLVSVALAERQEARGRKDYGAADRIRAALGEAGVAVEDTPAGPRWTLVEHEHQPAAAPAGPDGA